MEPLEASHHPAQLLKRFDTKAVILFVFALLCSVLSFALILWKIPSTREYVYLHYNIYSGIDRTGEWKDLFWIPGTGAAVLFVNALVLLKRHSDHFITHLSLGITLFFEMIVLLATLLVVLLNNSYVA